MDQASFQNVYDEHKTKVWGIVSRYVTLKQDKEDLFQEVFLNIYKALPKFRGEARLDTWIYRIAVNASLTYLKKKRRYKKITNTLNWMRIIDVEEPEISESEELLLPLKKLSPQQKMILLMSDVEEKSMEDIAGTLNIPIGTVKSSLHRARGVVKKEVMNNG